MPNHSQVYETFFFQQYKCIEHLLCRFFKEENQYEKMNVVVSKLPEKQSLTPGSSC